MVNKGKHVGELIRAHRTKKDMSQRDFFRSISSAATYYDYQMVSNCERGMASLSVKYFLKICSSLEISKEELMKAYISDYSDMLLTEVSKLESYEKRSETRRENHETDLMERSRSIREKFNVE